MIRRIDAPTDALLRFCGQDVYGTRTLGYLQTYGTERQDVSFYAQYVQDRLTAVLSDAFGHGAFTADDGAQWEELEAFFRFLRLDTLLCDCRTAQMLRLPTRECGFVMQSFGTERNVETERITPHDPRFSYRQVYDLLCACGFALGAFDVWRSDLALRVQRGIAEVVCVQRDGTTVCTASMLFSSPDAAYLGAVATEPAYRGQGLAGDLVRYLTTLRRKSHILCKEHRVSFYTSLGFQQIGEFSICPFSR